MSFIVNNTVLSNFAFVDRLDLLKGIFQFVYLTPEIQQEVINGVNEGYQFQERTQRAIDTQEWLKLTTLKQEEVKSFRQFFPKLDEGEASCLAAAKERGWLFLTDDMAARKLSVLLNVKIAGTIGVLLMAVEQRLISIEQGDALLQAMIDNGYFSPVNSLSEL